MSSSYYETPVSVRQRVAELQAKVMAAEASPDTVGGFFNADAERSDAVSEGTAKQLFPRAAYAAPYPPTGKYSTPPPPSHLGKHVRRAEALLEQAAEPDALALRLLRALEAFGSAAATMLVVARALRRESNTAAAITTEAEAQRWAASSLASADAEPLFGVTLRLMRLEALDAACAALSSARGGPHDRELAQLAHSRVGLQARLNSVSPGLDVGPPPPLLHLLTLFPVAPGQEGGGGEETDRFVSTPEPPSESGEPAGAAEEGTPLSARKGMNSKRNVSIVAAEGVVEAPPIVGVVLRMCAAALAGVTVYAAANAATARPAPPSPRPRKLKPDTALAAMLGGAGVNVVVAVPTPRKGARFSAEELRRGGYREVAVRYGHSIFTP